MRQTRETCLTMLAAGLWLTVSVGVSFAQSDGQGDGSGQISEAPVVFIPPDAGAPADRVGAGTRDVTTEGAQVVVLAPAGGGLTTRARPVLVWYLAQNFDGAVLAQIGSVSEPGRGVSRMSAGPLRAGYYALDLARSEMMLEPGQIYEWKVLLLKDAGGDILQEHRTYVERVAETEAAAGDDPAALAAAGLWFDALESFASPGLSGRVRISNPQGFAELVSSAGIAGLPESK